MRYATSIATIAALLVSLALGACGGSRSRGDRASAAAGGGAAAAGNDTTAASATAGSTAAAASAPRSTGGAGAGADRVGSAQQTGGGPAGSTPAAGAPAASSHSGGGGGKGAAPKHKAGHSHRAGSGGASSSGGPSATAGGGSSTDASSGGSSGSGASGPTYEVHSLNMEPTYPPRSTVYYDTSRTTPRVGDVVLFRMPLNAIEEACGENPPPLHACATSAPGLSQTLALARVVGVGGDSLAFQEGNVIRDGQLQHESSTLACGSGPVCTFTKPITVPEGSYYVLYDNRAQVDDSRVWGAIPQGAIVGTVTGMQGG